MIYIAGISIAIFFEFLLLAKKNKTHADRILLWWMFVICLNLFLFYMLDTEQSYKYTFLLGLMIPIPFLHGVFTYFYVASATNQFPKRWYVQLAHFIPTFATCIYLIPFMLRPANEKVYVYQNEGIGYEPFLMITYIGVIAFGLGYVIWSLILLRKHQKNIRDQYANVEHVNLNWLKTIIIGLGVIWIIAIIDSGDQFIYIGVSFLIFTMAFFGIKQVALIQPVEEKPKQKKYAKSGMKKDQSDELYAKLKEYVDNDEEWFMQTDLTIQDLASRLNVHPNYLSQIINEREEKNFFDFVNSYRLKAFAELIQHPESQRLTLLALAYDCGFNSKSSFNRYIKKTTGLTPTEYHKSPIDKP